MINGMNSLKDIKYISLALENCEGFDIEAKYILDIWFDEIHMGVGYNPKNKVYDGISVRGSFWTLPHGVCNSAGVGVICHHIRTHFHCKLDKEILGLQ